MDYDLEETRERIIGNDTFQKLLSSTSDEGESVKEEIKFLFWLINEKKFDLTIYEFNKLIDKLIEDDLMKVIIKNDNTILSQMTVRHIFTQKQFESIIWHCDVFDLLETLDNEFIENLVKKDFQFPDDTIKMLLQDCKTLTSNQQKLLKDKLKPNFDMVKFKHFVLTVHTPSSVVNYLKKNEVTVNYEIVFALTAWLRSNAMMQDFLEIGMERDIRILEFLCTDNSIDFGKITGMEQYIDEVIKELKSMDIHKLNFMFSIKSYKNMLTIIMKCMDHKIYFSIDKLKQLMKQVNSYTLHNSDIQGYRFEHNYSEEPTGEYFQILSLFLELNPDLYGVDFLEHVCKVRDELMFDLIIDRVENCSEECVLASCESGSKYMLKILLKKHPNLATVKCFDRLPTGYRGSNTEICDVLMDYGLGITHETIDILLNRGIWYHDLNKFGIEYDLKLYELCHKHNEYPYQYMSKISNINIDVRDMIKAYNCDEHKVIEQILTSDVKVDHMMYDDAVSKNKPILVEFFEREYGFKPNIRTLLRIDDFKKRMGYFKRIEEFEKQKTKN